MRQNSCEVVSSQAGVHPRLAEVVRRHIENPFRRAPSDAGRRAFAAVAERLASAPFVLDAGCGSGSGTFTLAQACPDRLVVGVDKSLARLAVGWRILDRGAAPANAVLLHCGLVDFWQLAAAAGLRCERQYLAYPNPWPKAEHLMRRWHAHPVLPALLALGGAVELRTNWRTYAEEFAAAMRLAGWATGCAAFDVLDPLTPFERKYAQSGHRLWRCVAQQSASMG